MADKVYDIDELKRQGKLLEICPFYTTKKNINDQDDDDNRWVDITFIPYNYLLSNGMMASRKQREGLIDNSIIILDEGHNVEQVAEDGATFQLGQQDLDDAQKELQGAIKTQKELQKFSGKQYQKYKGLINVNETETALEIIKVMRSRFDNQCKNRLMSIKEQIYKGEEIFNILFALIGDIS